jgi:hypothetical protein
MLLDCAVELHALAMYAGEEKWDGDSTYFDLGHVHTTFTNALIKSRKMLGFPRQRRKSYV